MKMKFRVVGADRETGLDVELVVDARDEVDAETEAVRRNVLVNKVSLCPKKLPPDPRISASPGFEVENRPRQRKPAKVGVTPPTAPEKTAKQCPACKALINGEATKCPQCRTKQPQLHSPEAWVFGAIAVIFIAAICSGILNSTPTSNHDSGASPYRSDQTTHDPRDERWDKPGLRQMIRGMAEEVGVSEEEMRRRLNDEIERRGLSDWADGKK